MKFDCNGNLPESITISFRKFKRDFGFNDQRKLKIEKLLSFLRIFQSLGCTNIYVVGSMVSCKPFPEDVDICIDATDLDYLKLLKKFPGFLVSSGIALIQKEHKGHFAAFFDKGCLEIVDWYRKDRSGNSRGIVKIFLNELETYDYK